MNAMEKGTIIHQQIEDYLHGGNPWWNHPEVAEPALYTILGLCAAGLLGLMVYLIWSIAI